MDKLFVKILYTPDLSHESTYFDVVSANTDHHLNRIGSGSFRIPVRSISSLRQDNLAMICHGDPAGDYTILGTILPEQRALNVTPSGKFYTISGRDIAHELTYRSTEGTTFDNDEGDSIEDIMDFAPSWGAVLTSGPIIANKNFYLATKDESVFDAFRLAADQMGHFFSTNHARILFWYSNDVKITAQITLENPAPNHDVTRYTEPEEISGRVFAPILSLRVDYLADDVVTRLTPYGAGLGEDRLTIKSVPASERAAIDLDFPDLTFNFDANIIIAPAFEGTGYPVIQKARQYGHIVPTDDTDAALHRAAIALAYSAGQFIVDGFPIKETFTIKTVLHSTALTLSVGEWIILDYDEQGLTLYGQYLVLDMKKSVAADGVLYHTLTLSSTHLDEMDDGRFVADKLKDHESTLAHVSAPADGQSTGAPVYHHDLRELNHNDHPQYVHVAGDNPIVGNIGMGSGYTIDGMDPSAHIIAPDAHHRWPLADADIPATIARDSEVTAAIGTHTSDADAHHRWPLLDADIPDSLARHSDVTIAIGTHAADADAHHRWPLEDLDIPASIARDDEVALQIQAHTNIPAAHHHWPLWDTDIPDSIARDSEVTAAIGTHTADAAAHHNWPLLDSDVPSTIARDSEVTAAIEAHRTVPDAHHQWPLLDENIPSTITRDNELAAHESDANAHHNWPLIDSDVPATIARDSEVTAEIASHTNNENAHHNQQHNITGTDHTITASKWQIVGAVGTNALGLITPTENPGAAEAIVRTDATGFAHLARLQADSFIGHAIPEQPDTSDLGSFLRHWRRAYISELSSTVFVENTISAIGGMFVVPHGQGTLPFDVTAAATAIDFDQTMTPGDFVELRGNSQLEYIQVGSLVSGTTYNVTRNLDSTSANDWPTGQIFIIRGNSGDGQLLFDAQTAGPRMSLLEQGATYNNQTERVRIGDMSGWGTYTGYGFGAGDPTGDRIAYTPATGLSIVGDGGSITNISGNNITTGQIAAERLELTDYLTVSQIGTDIDAAKEELETYVQSRGENLVTNGAGQILDLTNFTSWESFETEHVYTGFGSFLETRTTKNSQSDEFIPVDPSRRYRGDGWIRLSDPSETTKMYYGVCCYDIDYRAIRHIDIAYTSGTETTLAQDLNPNDTSIFLTDSANWIDNLVTLPAHQHSINWYPYTNDQGYTYDAYTYSRLGYDNGGYRCWDTNAINRTTHEITLNAPWSGPALPAGTQVSNPYGGGGYNYAFNSGQNFTGDGWHSLRTNGDAVMDGIQEPGINDNQRFRFGTAFVKLLFLSNYGTPVTGTYLSGVTFELDFETSRKQVLAWGHVNDTTLIDGGNIYTGSVTADQIAANTITASELNFTPTDSTNIVAEINASNEGLTINTAILNLTGILQVGDAASDVNAGITTIDGGKITANSISTNELNFTPTDSTNIVAEINASDEGLTINTAILNLTGILQVGDAASDVNAGVTTIDGGKITANTISANELNFTPVGFDNIVGTINTSSEGITINAALLNLNGVVEIGNSAADVNAGTTTIDGGKITADTITATHINVTSLESITVTTGSLDISGVLTIGANGGIWQGTGTFASPINGLKVWNDGNVGRLSTYHNSNLQVELDAEGQLVAGAGVLVLNEEGITIIREDTTYSAWNDGYSFQRDTGAHMGGTRMRVSPDNNILELAVAQVDGTTYDHTRTGIIISTSDVNGHSISLDTLNDGDDSSISLSAEEINLWGGTGLSQIRISGSQANLNKIYMLTETLDIQADTIAYLKANVAISKGLVVGYTATPTDEQIRLYRGSTLMGQISTADTTWLRINQDVAKNIYTPRSIALNGGLSVGHSTIQSGGVVAANGDGRFGGGLAAGSYTLNPSTGQVMYTATLISRKNSISYAVYGMKYLTTPLIIKNNVTQSTSGWVTLTGVPSTAKSVLVRISHKTATLGRTLAVGPGSGNTPLVARMYSTTVASEAYGDCPTNGTNQIWLYISSTLTNVYLHIYGYAI